MRKIVIALAAAGVAGATLTAYAANMPSLGQLSAGSTGSSGYIVPVKTDDEVYDYCMKVMSDMKRGGKYGETPDFAAMDCVGLFATAAESGQPGRGGDGGGLPGLPGGKGGAAGGAGGGSSSSAARASVDKALLDYCAEVLKRSRPGAPKGKPATSARYEPEDCADYFASLDMEGSSGRSGRDGADGASIAGGQGGKGGKAGSGSGGGAGGGGGVGLGGGKGGKGGAGGSTD